MSGHSHWKTIKRTKDAEDKKRGRVFSKLSKIISIAAKEGGIDPTANPRLRIAIDEAKKSNMPKANIEKAIKKGSGELPGENLEEVLFEAYGPNNIAIIIEGITDNKNRTLGEIKKIISSHGGKLANEGSVKWMFDKMGIIVIDLKMPVASFQTKEELELAIIEMGVKDIVHENSQLILFTKPEELEKIKKILEEKGIEAESSSLDWVAKEYIDITEKDKEVFEKLFESLDDNDAVQNIYCNIKQNG